MKGDRTPQLLQALKVNRFHSLQNVAHTTMIYQLFRPLPALQDYVKEYLLLHFKFEGLSVNPSRPYTPQAEQCLTFDPRGRITAIDRQSGTTQHRSYAYFSAQQTTCYDLHFDSDYLMLKVVFQPGALFKLFGTPLHELTGYIDADAIMNKEIAFVNEQLVNTEDYLKMIQIVELYLLNKTKGIKNKNRPIDKLANILNLQPDRFSLKWFADQACLSPRQFERKFLECIGVNPKLYCRITRFNKAFELKNTNPQLDWLSIAMACGYTDFQHLNKDFKQFADVTPTTLLREYDLRTEKMLNLV